MSAYSDMVDSMNNTYSVPISAMAPTEATTSNALTSASSGLENLLKLAVGGYTSILGAKSAATQAKVNLSEANKTGIAAPRVADDSGFSINPKVILIGAGLVAAALAGFALLRPAKG